MRVPGAYVPVGRVSVCVPACPRVQICAYVNAVVCASLCVNVRAQWCPALCASWVGMSVSVIRQPKWTACTQEHCGSVCVSQCDCVARRARQHCRRREGQLKLPPSTCLTPTPAALLITCNTGSGPRGALAPATFGKERGAPRAGRDEGGLYWEAVDPE